MKTKTTLSFLVFTVTVIQAQTFYFGNDLSYVNQMEDCGADYKESGVSKDVYQIFADHGTNLVSVRLWLDPSWWQDSLEQPVGVKAHYNDLEDVKETIQRAKEAGMQVMLGFQYSDVWADPGRQAIPKAWYNVANNLPALKDSLYNYTMAVLKDLDKEGLMPEVVKVGNETNSGMLNHIPQNGQYVLQTLLDENWTEVDLSIDWWQRQAQLFNSAIQAVRDAGANSAVNPRIVIHFAGLNQQSNFANIMNNGVTDFDIAGISYYYAWHDASIAQLQTTIASMVNAFKGYDVMVIETGYPWTLENFDQLGNIINEASPAYLPVIPEKQLEYLIDYTRAVKKGGGIGVTFWEPAWVSTPCRTPWGVGSSHDHVVFFDPNNTNFIENGAGRWIEQPYYDNLETHKVTFKVDMNGQEVSNGVYITGSFTGEEWQILPMAEVEDGIYSYFTYLPASTTGGYYFLNDSVSGARESIPEGCVLWQDSARFYEIPDRDVILTAEWGLCAEDSQETGSLIELENPSFEQPGVQTTDWAAIPGWSLDQPAIDSGVSPNDLATDAAFAAWLDSDDGELWQLTNYTIMSGDVFTLSADVRNSWQTNTFDLRLYYDDDGSRIPIATTTGNFGGTVDAFLTEFSVTLEADKNPQAIGKLLGVAIENTSAANSFIEMDNFRLYKNLPTTIVAKKNMINDFVLQQNFPNPFNPTTIIEYTVGTQHAVSLHVNLSIYNLLGQKLVTLVDKQQPGGNYQVEWNARGFPSGIYFIHMQAGSFSKVIKMSLLR